MTVHLFGAATPTGASFQLQSAALPQPLALQAYSRSAARMASLDLCDPASFDPKSCKPGDVWVSFAPIWLFSHFLACVRQLQPGVLEGLAGIVCCSSSSVLTKRYASNRFDRDLVQRLRDAEDSLLIEAQALGVRLQILRPTLIYGACGAFGDRNLSRLVGLMRSLPFIPLPNPSGLRQPIHVTQLASVALKQAQAMLNSDVSSSFESCQSLGGDESLSYHDMLVHLQAALPAADPARRCRLIAVPQRLFFAAACPVLLLSPKTFEALMRMGADLSPFTPAHELLGQPKRAFPVLPIALP